MAVTDRRAGYSIGMAFKLPCYVASTTNITLSGSQTVDGLTVGGGQRVLAPFQTNPVERGIYVSDSGAWSRASDCDGSNDIVPGSLVYVDRGSAYSRTVWSFNSSSTATTITIDTDNITITQTQMAFSAASAWVETNFFPVTSAASARSAIAAAAATDAVSETAANTFLGFNEFAAGVTFSSDVAIADSHGGSTFGPVLMIDRWSTSAAANDQIGAITFRGRDQSNGSFEFAQICGLLSDPTTGSCDGGIMFKTASSGSTMANRLSIGTGVFTPGATDPGFGSINSSENILIDGHPVEGGWFWSTEISTSSTTAFRISLSSEIPSTIRTIEIFFSNVVTNTASASPYINVGTATSLAIASTVWAVDVGYVVTGAGANAYNVFHGMPLLAYGAAVGNVAAHGKIVLEKFISSTDLRWIATGCAGTDNARVHTAAGIVTMNTPNTPSIQLATSATTIFFTGGSVAFRYR